MNWKRHIYNTNYNLKTYITITMEERNFGHLGFSFQQSLIKAIIEDKKYGETIIDVLESKFFENNSFRFIMENVKELYKTYNKIPDYNTVAQKIMSEGGNKDSSKVHVDTLDSIKNNEQQIEYVKDTALNFCKQQNLKKELKGVQSIIDNGDFEIKQWATEPGDVVAFNFKLIHGANANKVDDLSRTLSFRLLGDDVVYRQRLGRTSPNFPEINQKNGERLREDWFPTIWSN